jgi:hypothetical protein
MENPIVERVKSQAKNLKILSEELKVQMALGKAEARDLVERERKTFTKYINRQRQEIEKIESENSESRRDFLTAVENLESSLFEEVPSKVRAYESYKKTVMENIFKLEEQIRDNYPSLNQDVQETLDTFKAKLDAFRVNLALHDKDDPETVKNVKADLTNKLDDIRILLSKQEESQSRLDNFVEDITESFNYLKRAIADLSS